MKPLVSIIMGSTSDLPVMEKAAAELDSMEIPFEMNALSAHRTPEEVCEFAKGAEARGIKVIVDIVPNHSSNQHPWFKAALAAGPGSPERARYIFRNGRGEHGELPPTNWNANFGGPAWTRVADGQW